MYICLLTYFLTPYRRVLLEKLIGFQLVNKSPVFYGTRRFIIAVTSARQLSLSGASSIHSTLPHPTSWRSILILPSHLRLGLPSDLIPSGFPHCSLWLLFLSWFIPIALLIKCTHCPVYGHKQQHIQGDQKVSVRWKTQCIRTIPTQLMSWRWPSQITFGMWTVLYWTRS